MALTAIVKCPNCTGLFLSGVEQKTKMCPYCGKGVNLQKATRVAQAASAVEASELLKQLKAKNAKNVSFKVRRV
jgi:acetyl-CoA carboxylase beta subunit